MSDLTIMLVKGADPAGPDFAAVREVMAHNHVALAPAEGLKGHFTLRATDGTKITDARADAITTAMMVADTKRLIDGVASPARPSPAVN